MVMAHDEPYTLEQAEDDITALRGQVDRLSEVLPGGLIFIVGGALVAADPVNGGPETWHSLGSLGAHYTIQAGRYRLTIDNQVELDVEVTGDGAQAGNTQFANALPAAYRPLTGRHPPMGGTRNVTAGDLWPRLSVSSAGAVQVIDAGTADNWGINVSIPLD
jgi:hypothetical protein